MLQETLKFELPSILNASMPPERRGVRRDQVKMMVQNRKTGLTTHDHFFNLDDYLRIGDVLVLNSSRTVPAILKSELLRNGILIYREIEIRLARRINERTWEVLAVTERVENGDLLVFTPCLTGEVISAPKNTPFITIQFNQRGSALYNEIYAIGEPVRYEYINSAWGLDYYQTVFATHLGSVEMPSAGRAFSWELLFKLQKKGIKLVFIQLHTGLSYLLDDKWEHSPTENREEYNIPGEAWEDILQAKMNGKRIIAVGTTVVRAMETAALNGCLSGWTNLYIKQNYNIKIADGIITGMHEPEASHLDMLSAFIKQKDLFNAYQEAISMGYLWHEFGDMNLIL
ncbi:S-adenosylmethionine:tRNA ribosyltransferase-isomerase [Paenibacillus sp. BSR1-1]|uniref:S-adenosylmethionine:tRNA ribosyltransferase-isomerase n=1 Tax=Paenibacillus sp. BSR1-1 TaxID=3020845 RepID=UPI0025B036DC|nr:S-adenosylmethionine:tRNA ribosyltransferase-isomerase [Paenibacillus sp. BSR1-1]MDN3018714.1 S-adenosylmethionine:tRNA ribosyltransferase-isomerase [Paenibacillus sp. BSR1-1]